jgi:hypothetical protein
MGGFIIYRCPPDFPSRIPGLLAAEGWESRSDDDRVQEFPNEKVLFLHRISDGPSIMELAGGAHADGSFYFCLIPRWGWTWNPRLSHSRQSFQDRVIAVLLREGASIMTAEDLEELERSTPP